MLYQTTSNNLMHEVIGNIKLQLYSCMCCKVITITDNKPIFADLQQVDGFLQVFWFPPPIKLIATI